MTVHVHVFARSTDEDAVTAAYHEISKALQGTPGLLGNALLHDAGQPDRYLVLSRWTSLEAFEKWEQGPDHRAQTAPLRRFVDREASGGRFVTVAEY